MSLSRVALAAFAALGVAVGGCVAGGGCGEAEGGVTLELWAMGREGEVVPELLGDFLAAHPGVRVRVQQIPWSAAHEKLLTAYVADSLPDVAQLGNTWIAELAALGALSPLDEALAGSRVIDERDYFPGLWQSNRVAGELVGVPWYVDTRLLFYRRDLLARAGYEAVATTWAGWAAQLHAVARRAGPGDHALFLPVDEFEQLLTLALSLPEPLLRDGDGRGNFRSTSFARALTYYLDLFRRGAAPVAAAGLHANVWEGLGRGSFAFLIHGPWSVGELRRRLPAERQRDWATAPMPGPDGPGAGIAGGSSLVRFSSCRGARASLAWQLIEHLSSPASQRRFFAITGNLPPRRESWRDPALASDAAAHAFLDQLERARPAPQVPEWERIMQELRHVGERAARQVRSTTSDGELAAIVEAAGAELDRRVDRILAKRRWMMARRRAR